MKSTMTATKLKIILTFCIILMILAAGVGFYFAQDWLRTLAKDSATAIAQSTAVTTSVDNAAAIKALQDELAAQQTVTTKAASLLASASDYQTQAIRDIDRYAALSGVSVTNFGFGAAAAAAKAPASSTTPAATTTPAAATRPTITLTLTSPVSYVSLLKFIKLIETNLPKMQISSVNVSGITGDKSNVTADSMIIEIYTQ